MRLIWINYKLYELSFMTKLNGWAWVWYTERIVKYTSFACQSRYLEKWLSEGYPPLCRKMELPCVLHEAKHGHHWVYVRHRFYVRVRLRTEQNNKYFYFTRVFLNGSKVRFLLFGGFEHDENTQYIIWLPSKVSLHTSQVVDQAVAYPGFCSMKPFGVFLLPHGWDASPSQCYPQH